MQSYIEKVPFEGFNSKRTKVPSLELRCSKIKDIMANNNEDLCLKLKEFHIGESIIDKDINVNNKVLYWYKMINDNYILPTLSDIELLGKVDLTPVERLNILLRMVERND